MSTAADAGALPPAEGDAPIHRRTLHGEVAARLRDMIVEGRLAPGARLNETHLGVALGVSRTPLREAVRTLASEGLIDLVPSRGAVVRRFHERDVAEILEVLKALESLAGRLACERGSDREIAQVRRLHDAMMAHYAAGERLAYFKLNQAIHSAIVAMSGNASLVDTHGTLQARIRRIRFIGNESPEKWAGAVADHEEIVAALEARHPERLAAILARHMDNTLTRVRDTL